MNAALSVILSVATVLAGGAAALGQDLLSPHSVPADDCVAGVCLGGGHGNETSEPGNETGAGNGTADPEPQPEPEPEPEQGNETGHYHHHHYHNGTDDGAADNRTAEPDGPEDVHFCTSGLMLLGESYTFSWDVHEGFEVFELAWHFQSYGLGLLSEPDVRVELVDGAGTVVLSAEGDDALGFFLGTEDLRGYAPGEWSFTVVANDLAADQGLVGTVEY